MTPLENHLVMSTQAKDEHDGHMGAGGQHRGHVNELRIPRGVPMHTLSPDSQLTHLPHPSSTVGIVWGYPDDADICLPRYPMDIIAISAVSSMTSRLPQCHLPQCHRPPVHLCPPPLAL
ncbi:unnamed protein product [Cyclocybe aegerita]|uniref:Uncharacterized protein n=1 Tax=Cyclocybe aegerita TaxID=1973307 RepID=A0A8S0W1A0_CYCAE|nr:unnamed protein product [Cyclocybe aegerita]